MTTRRAARDRYRPGAANVEVEVRADGRRWTLVFVRTLSHPPTKVWRALTDPDTLREWAPFDADRDLGSTGRVTLTLAGTTAAEALDGEVLHAEPPRLLEYTWAGGVVRWELEALEAGTRLTLRHTIDDRNWAPKLAAGWHLCLDVAERLLADRAVGRIAGADARPFDWERLNAEYSSRFGVENTGWPDEIA